MAIGTSRIHTVIPVGSQGHWGNPLGMIAGCTVVEPVAGAPFTLVDITATLTNAAGVVVVEPVHDGAIFIAPWTAAGSVWNNMTGILTMERTGGFAVGTKIKFTVHTLDGVNNHTYSSWYVGIGAAPRTLNPVDVGEMVRTADGALWRVDGTVGGAGAVKYRCTPLDKTRGGVLLTGAVDLEVVGPRDRLDDRILIAE